MLDVYYTTEKPLPTEIRAVCRLVMATTEGQREAVQIVLEEFFDLTPDGWINYRADEEIDAMRSKQQMQREKANKRWHKPSEDSGNAPEMPRHEESDAAAYATASMNDAEAMPPTPTPTPTNSVANATGGEPPKALSPDEIIFGYGIPLLTNAGTADKQARSFLGGLRKQYGDQALIEKLRVCLREKPLQPLEWLAAAMPPKGGLTVRTPPPENFANRDYGTGGRL